MTFLVQSFQLILIMLIKDHITTKPNCKIKILSNLSKNKDNSAFYSDNNS